MDGVFLPEHGALEVGLELPQRLGVGLGDRLGRDAGDLGYHHLDFLQADHLLTLAFGEEHLRRSGLVNDVDRLVGKFPVGDVFIGQFNGRPDRFGRILQLVELLVVCLQTLSGS